MNVPQKKTKDLILNNGLINKAVRIQHDG